MHSLGCYDQRVAFWSKTSAGGISPKSRGQYALSLAGESRDQKAKQNVSAPGRHFIGIGLGWTFSGIGIQYDMVS